MFLPQTAIFCNLGQKVNGQSAIAFALNGVFGLKWGKNPLRSRSQKSDFGRKIGEITGFAAIFLPHLTSLCAFGAKEHFLNYHISPCV